MPDVREQGRPGHYFDPGVVDDYDRRYRSGLGRWKHRRKCRTLRAWLEGLGSALEVACGPGRFREVFRHLDTVHSDLSPEMLRYFGEQDPTSKRVRADAARLPFEAGSFDAVVTIRFVSHLRGEYRRQVLGELARVSRRYVILDARHLYSLRYWSRWFRRRLGLARADKLRHTFAELERELADAGLILRRTRCVAWGLSGRVLLLAEKASRAPE